LESQSDPKVLFDILTIELRQDRRMNSHFFLLNPTLDKFSFSVQVISTYNNMVKISMRFHHIYYSYLVVR